MTNDDANGNRAGGAANVLRDFEGRFEYAFVEDAREILRESPDAQMRSAFCRTFSAMLASATGCDQRTIEIVRVAAPHLFDQGSSAYDAVAFTLLASAAHVVRDIDPELSTRLIAHANDTLRKAMFAYGKRGGAECGPNT